MNLGWASSYLGWKGLELSDLARKWRDMGSVGFKSMSLNCTAHALCVHESRYADFIVNEVDCDGKVVHLTCLDAPLESVEEKKSEETKLSYSSEIESFRSLAGDTDAELLKALIDKVTSGGTDDASPIVLSPDSDKTHRTARNGKGRNSRKRKERGDKPFDSRGSDDWPENVGKFLRFHLYKENKDTQEALGLIAKMLGIQQRSFGFSGTKDKRSVSTQRVTVFKQHSKRLAALNDRLIGIKVGNFCYVKEGILLGQLEGNRFTITLRGVVSDSEDIIKSAADSLGRNGFINYFGLQRDIIREAREYYKETGDIDGMLSRLPRYLVAERAILQCLKKCPGNYLQALKAIPRTLRMMYVHSYQSYLWNHAASARVQRQGTAQLMLGDLVYCKGGSAEKPIEAINSECEDGDSTEAYDCSHIEEIPGISHPEEKDILAVNEEDLLRREYKTEDMVLPLPGSRVLYPMNDIAEVYHDLANKDGITLTDCVHNAKEFSITNMSGGYRRVFQKPVDFEWELLHYTDGDVPLAETDLDAILKSKPLKNFREERKSENEVVDCREKLENLNNGAMPLGSKTEAGDGGVVEIQVNSFQNPDTSSPQIALKLGFTLPASCYATMAIRELLKLSTSLLSLWKPPWVDLQVWSRAGFVEKKMEGVTFPFGCTIN
ncbi:hypothetical protein IFM89_002261 [Coptis chinensis]|uniref:TRUD domain-containing protein n=1 Tax=Coptis chinensis TaxID=261450 RepID=A0A835MCC3_9MAGN|nr:hypothetical protein IFM89_002261 [Coptis chinensis]